MKILIVSHMYLSTFDKISFFTHQQARELKKQGHDVRVIAPLPWTPFPIKHFSNKWNDYASVPRKMTWNEINVYYPRYLEFPRALFFASSGKRMYWGIKKIVAKIYKNFKFDIIHSHVALPDGYCGMMIAQKYNKPLIVTIHGQDFQQTIHKNKKCKKTIEKVINFSKKTIVVSNKLKKIGENGLNINYHKLITIPNGINETDIYQGKNDLGKKYKNKKIILSVSNLIKIKGIDYNIKAIAKLIKKYPKIIYLIIGTGPEKKNLESLTEKLNIKNFIQFLGPLPHKKVMEYISICDIFSLPSWNEAFGVVYLEAMVHKKPVIAIKNQGIDGIIKNKKNGLLVDSKNVNQLTEAFHFLFSSPEITKEIGEMAQKTILKNYIWSNVVKKIIEVYKKN